MVKTLVRLSILVILVVTLVKSGHAEETLIFGPKTFKVDKTQSLISNEVFSSAATGSNFILRVQNGDAAGRYRVTSGSVTLNGLEVLSPSDLNQQVLPISTNRSL